MHYVIMLIFCFTIRHKNKGAVSVIIYQGYITVFDIDRHSRRVSDMGIILTSGAVPKTLLGGGGGGAQLWSNIFNN